VLGPVVLEDAAQVAQARQQQQVAEEDAGAQHALDEPEQERGVQLVLDEARQAHRDDEEQPDRHQHGDDDRAGPDAAGDLLLVLGQLGVGADAQGLEADGQRLAERHDAADERQAQDAVLLEQRGQRVADDLDRAERDLLGLQPALAQLLGRGLAHGDRPGRDAAHHDALEDGLAAHGGIALGYQRIAERPVTDGDSGAIG
jgi:hypothetical protein